jgi:hypothetical protein
MKIVPDLKDAADAAAVQCAVPYMTEVEFHEADYYYFLAPIFAKSTAP